jgi:putative ABC transport system permease protein
MLLADLLRVSLRQVYRNKRRYKGAFIGISLGIGALVTVFTVGESVESLLGENLEILGNATIVKAEWDHYQAIRWHFGEYRFKDVEDLRLLPSVLEVAPAVMTRRTVSFERWRYRARLVGVEPSFVKVMYLPLVQGRHITQADMARRASVCVIGHDVRTFLGFSKRSPLGEQILVRGTFFTVVGVLGDTEDETFRETILLPINVAMARIDGMDKILHVYVRARDWDSVPELKKRVAATLKGNQPGYEDSMVIRYPAHRIVAIKAIVLAFKLFLVSAIGVTLLLGGLGITNVMLSIVAERTQEIGLRKAVGATELMIMAQFLCESLTVSLTGAVLGIALGAAGVYVLSDKLGTATNVPILALSIAGSMVIGIVLGVASGVLPALRAGRLNPVEAMKFE